jgi:type IX secretion system PorP/SprF family membrane protein
MDKFYLKKRIPVSIISLLLLLITVYNANAQQAQPFAYTQYMDNLVLVNPAYSLLDQAGSVYTLASKQLIGINGGPTTFLANANVPIESITSAAGFSLLSDELAIEHEIEANLYFAKGIQLGENDYLGVSLNAGLRNYVANYSSLDPNDPTFKNDVRQTKPNVGFGVMYYTDTYYVGVSVPELTINSLGTASVQNNTNFTNHYYFAAGWLASLDEDIKFKPATLVSYATGSPVVANISGTFYFKGALGLGVNYETDKAMAGIITINVDAFHIGYSYKFSVASENLGGINNATHEITLSYRFGKTSQTPKLL